MAKIRTLEACAAAIADIGEVDRKVGEIQSELDKQVAQLKDTAEKKAQPLEDKRAGLVAQVREYCDANRVNLTGGGKTQSATFTTGEAGWRKGRPKLEVDPTKLDKIIADLSARPSMRRFLNVKTTLDQRAILKEPEKFAGLKGLAFKPADETFWVKPVALELAGKQEVGAKG